ncbi:ABC transporter substrate-binding protein [Kitasatospora sp. NPDC048540]|uniref:ABC transporter substrate-binding protein n=1 Tax=Kitasatospora sp. NPDC048540 TaxID=3155634 RepID=UPI0033D78DBF
MNLRARAMALLAAFALAAAGCGSSDGGEGKPSTPGVTEDTVTIGGHVALTGPAAPGFRDFAPAVKAYFDYVNDNGGVHGRKIVYKYRDDAYNPSTTVDAVHELVEQDKVFAIVGGQGTPTHTKVTDYLNSQKVPDLFVGSGCPCWDAPSTHPYTFGWPLDYIREGKILGAYVASAFPGKKVAYFTQNDDFGKSGVEGLDRTVPASSVVTRQTYEPGNLDITPQMTAIDNAKADVIIAYTIPTYTAQLRLAQIKLGNTAQLVVSYPGADPLTLSQLLNSYAAQSGSGSGDALIQGMVTDTFLPPLSGSSGWSDLFMKVRDHYAPSLPESALAQYGMGVAFSFTQALQKAGKNPTRQSIVDAVQSGGLTSPGLVPYAYSAQSHAGFSGSQVAEIKGTELTLQGKPLTTDDGNGPVTAYTGDLPTALNGLGTG